MEKTYERTLSISDFIGVAKKCWYFMLIVFIVVGSIGAVYSSVNYTPVYSTHFMMFIRLNDSTTQSGTYSSGEYQMDKLLANDIVVLLKSDEVLGSIADKVNTNPNYKGTISKGWLRGTISVKANLDGSRVIMIQNKADTPENAKIISVTLCEVLMQYVNSIVFGEDRITTMDMGMDVSPYPSNPKYTSMNLIVPFVAALLIYAIFFAIEMLNDKIRTVDECERYLGVSVLGTIPNVSEASALGKKGSKKKISIKKKGEKK